MHNRLFVLLCVLLLSGRGEAGSNKDALTKEKSSSLAALVESYFHTHDSDLRTTIAASIVVNTDGDVDSVARAVERVDLWSPVPTARGVFSVQRSGNLEIQVEYVLPDDYNEMSRHPLIICLSEAEQDGVFSSIVTAESCLGSSLSGFVMLSPRVLLDPAFHRFHDSASDLRTVLLQARKLFHIDTDRVFIFGKGKGADAAWMAAMLLPDVFAGVVTVSGFPDVPYPEQTYPLLLGNLSDLPVVTIWRDVGSSGGADREAVVSARNRGIVNFASKVAIPIRGIEIQGDAPLVVPPEDANKLLRGRRARSSPRVSRWFGGPTSAGAGWLVQTEFSGEEWMADQISIRSAPGTDREEWIRTVVMRELGFLGGRVEGQNIYIETRRSGRLELWIVSGLVDLASPVSIFCNGKARYSGVIEPGITTLLDHAYQTWDFQRLVLAKRSFAIRDAAPSP